MIIVGNTQTQLGPNYDEPALHISIHPQEKIHEDLLLKIQDPYVQDDFVNIFVMFDVDKPNIEFPKGVEILKQYELINAMLIKAKISQIPHIAAIPEVRSIWEDLMVQTDITLAKIPITMIGRRKIIPPIVGVPVFFRWVFGPSSLTV